MGMGLYKLFGELCWQKNEVKIFKINVFAVNIPEIFSTNYTVAKNDIYLPGRSQLTEWRKVVGKG